MRQSLAKAVNEGVGQWQQLRRRASESTLQYLDAGKDRDSSDEGPDAAVARDPLLRSLIAGARSAAVREEFLRLPPENYTADHDVKILTGTYNVNGQTPPEDLDLTEWLGSGRHADIVAVALQEAVPLSASYVVLGGGAEAMRRWDELVRRTLNAEPGKPWQAGGPTPPPAELSERLRAVSRQRLGPQDGDQAATEVEESVATGEDGSAGGGTVPSGKSDAAGEAVAGDKDDGGRSAEASEEPSVVDDGTSTLGGTGPSAGTQDSFMDACATTGGRPSPSVADSGPGSFMSPSPRASPGSASPGSASPASADYHSGDESLDTSLDGDPAAFVQVAARQLVGIYLSVWVRRGLLPVICGVQLQSVATGMMGYLGNKGAVAIRMRIHDTGVCFISSHLASGEGSGDEARRHYDHQEILRRCHFAPVAGQPAGRPSQEVPDEVSRIRSHVERDGMWGEQTHLLSVEHIFWMGDLNYRLAGGLTGREVAARARAGELESLLKLDQLRRAQRSGAAFAGWVEAAIRFPPTFKFKRGSAAYLSHVDPVPLGGGAGGGGTVAEQGPLSASLTAARGGGRTLSLPDCEAKAVPGSVDSRSTSVVATGGPASPALQAIRSATPPPVTTAAAAAGTTATERPRVPAWTDRILYRSASPGRLRQMSYDAAQNLRLSDHRPVSAAFILRCRELVRAEVEAALDVARRLVDAREMAVVPRCSVSPTAAELGELEYGEERVVQLALRNEGRARAEFQFILAPGGLRCPWIALEPSQGAVMPGQRVSVTLRARVTGGPGGCAETLVSSLACSLEGVVVLRVAGGNDVFLAVGGDYRPSWMGLKPLTLAARLPLPVSGAWGTAGGGGAGLEVGGGEDDKDGAGVEAEEEQGSGDGENKSAGLPQGTATTADGANASVELSETTPAPTSEQSVVGEALQPSPRRSDSVPDEMDRLLSALSDPEALAVPGIFLVDAAELLPGRPERPDVGAVRRALERGEGRWPEGTGPRELAATLLAALAALPDPLLPESAKALCDVATHSSAATALGIARGALEGGRRELFERVLTLLRSALAPEATERNGLAPAALAVVLADVAFPPLARGPAPTAAEGSGAAPGSNLADLAEVAMRRIRFVQHVLEG